MDMKRIGFLLLLWMASVATATAQSFPSGKKFYFGREDGRLMTVSLMYDNKGDAVASVMLGYASHLFLCTGTSDEWFSFEGYTLTPNLTNLKNGASEAFPCTVFLIFNFL